MNSKFSISVTIPTLKTHPTLFESLEGYFNQTIKPSEIIIVGDVSWKIKKFIKTKKNNIVKLIQFTGDKNEARNVGFLKASGDYVLYADDDMIPQNNLLE